MTGVRRRSAGAVLALAAALSPLVAAALPIGAPGAPAGAVAATRAPSPSPTRAPSPSPTPATPLTVEIDTIAPEVLRPGEDLSVTATLRNAGSTPVDGVVADLRLFRSRAASRADLEAWVTGSRGDAGTRVVSADPVSVPAGGSATVQLTLPAAAVHLLDLPGTWGPRGMAVEALGADGSALGIQRTFVLWMRDEVVPQVRVAVAAPVTGPTTDATALEQATGPGGRLGTLVQLATAHPEVELAVDPALVTAASTGGAQASAWATRLTADLARRDAFALPWGDTDLAAVAHAGTTQLLDTAIALSASSDLSGVDARTDVLWAPDGTLDQATVDTAAAAGAKAIVVGADTLQLPDALGTAKVPLATAHGPLPALVPDQLLTNLLVAPDDVEHGATPATAVQRMLAEIAVLAHDGSDQQHDVLLAPGRGWMPSPALADALLQALGSSPWSRLVSVTALLGGDEGAQRAALPASVADAGELAPDSVRSLAAAHDLTTTFAQAIGDQGTLTAGLDQRVLTPLSSAWRDDASGRDALVHQVLADTAASRAGLSLTGPPSLNVISASAPVRFVVHNALNVPATVAVAVEPRKACLRSAHSDPVTAAPGADTQVVVDLVAAANCEVGVQATLVGANGVAVGVPVRFSARVAPTIENVGTVVVGVVLAVGLLLGIARTVRRGRSARRGSRTAPEDTAPLPVLGGDVPPDDEPGQVAGDGTGRGTGDEAAPDGSRTTTPD